MTINTITVSGVAHDIHAAVADSATTATTAENTEYAESAGTASTATTATKLGTSTVGSTTVPIYLSSGSPKTATGVATASSVTSVANDVSDLTDRVSTLEATSGDGIGDTSVGSSTQPIYLSSGTFKACSTTVGSTTKPMYLASGVATAFSSTIGGTAKPVYLSSGAITACTNAYPPAGAIWTRYYSSTSDLSVTSSGWGTLSVNNTKSASYAATLGTYLTVGSGYISAFKTAGVYLVRVIVSGSMSDTGRIGAGMFVDGTPTSGTELASSFANAVSGQLATAQAEAVVDSTDISTYLYFGYYASGTATIRRDPIYTRVIVQYLGAA